MYKLQIRMDPDGQFAYSSSFINLGEPEIELHTHSRNQAVKLLKEFYNELTSKFTKRYIEQIDLICEFKPYLFKLIDTVDGFNIIFNMHNSEFEISLIKYIDIDYFSHKGTIATQHMEQPVESFYVHKFFKEQMPWATFNINK